MQQILHGEQAKPFLEQLKQSACRWCNTPLLNESIKGYDHSGGWTVPGYTQLLWLYITCPKCGYDWALWKLGVDRE